MTEKPTAKPVTLDSLTKNICDILVYNQPNPIKLDHFWQMYQSFYGSIPKLKDLPAKIKKSRNEVFKHCNFCEIVNESDGNEYVCLKKNKSDPEQELYTVTEKIKEVLVGIYPEEVKKNSFWNEYRKKFQSLPDLNKLPKHINKRSDIFNYCHFCHTVSREDGPSSDNYLVLNEKTQVADKGTSNSTLRRNTSDSTQQNYLKPSYNQQKSNDSSSNKSTSRPTDNVFSQLSSLQNENSGAYSKLSGKKYPSNVRFISNLAEPKGFTLDDFPALGEEPKKVEESEDTMAMRERGGRGNLYHPYMNTAQHQQGMQIQQPQMIPMMQQSFQQPYQQPLVPVQAGSFYDQFYANPENSSSSNSDTSSDHVTSTPSAGASASRQRQGEGQSGARNVTHAYYMSQGFHEHSPAPPAPSRGIDVRYQSRGSQRQNTRNYSGSSGKPVHATKEQLNAVAKESIGRLADAKEYVSVERVEKLILQHFGVNNLSQLNVYNIEHIDAVRELMRAHGKVNAYIQAFMRTRSVSTLHELQADLENLCCKKGEDFETLQVGPLQSQPIVYDYFKFPEKATIPVITTCDVLDMLRDWLSSNNLWTSRDLDLQKFMEYMQETSGVETPYELGVRIRSLILLIQVLKRAQSECSRSVRDIVKTQKDKFRDDLAMAFQNLLRSFLQNEPGNGCVVKQEYMQKNAFDAVVQIFERIKLFNDKLLHMSGNHSATLMTKSERRHASKLNEVLLQFKMLLLNDPVHCEIFRLVVCSSVPEIHEQLWERILKHFEPRLPKSMAKRRHIIYDSDGEEIEVIDENLNVESDEDYDEEQASSKKHGQPKPSKGAVEEKIHRYLERCLMQGALTLELLRRIEDKILEDFGFGIFSNLGHGSFLECLTNFTKIKDFLDESGGMTVGGSQHGGSKSAESVYHATQHHLLDFIRQSGITDNQQISLLEDAICSHYHVTDVKNLGHGSVQHLLNLSSKQQQRQQKEFNVVYEGASCAKNRGLSITGERKVGMLGHQTRDKALACLQNCPLLENLEDWSQWELVFKPEYGDLKDFIQKYGRLHNSIIQFQGAKYTMTTHIIAMETKPGTLLKLTANTSPEKFEEAVNGANVTEACGHLLSLLAMNKGIENLPMPLLGNHLKTALIKMQANENEDICDDGLRQGKISNVSQFVVECLTMLPFAVCQAVTNKVFLEPLSQVVGSAKSKDALLQAASTHQQQGRLQLLGCALGITEWVNSFESRTVPPKECLEKHEVPMEFAGLEGGDEITISDEETEESDDEEEVQILDELSSDEEDSLPVKESVTSQKVSTCDNKSKASKMDQSEDGVATEVSSVDPNLISSNEEVVDQSKDINLTGNDEKIQNKCTSMAIAKYGPNVSPRFLLIEEIRRNKFGVNFEMSEEFRALFESQSEMMGRGLERLSKDLYSKDTHFVLELIQNADDNDYPGMLKDGLTVASDAPPPSVLFCVETDKISVFNNETGFQEKNIRAVCDVGRSTKGKHKFGYIGQKGIGFKSVFRVTDQPEIHSNGFHICFDVNSGPMGYIMPHWIGKMPKEKQSVEVLEEDEQTVDQNDVKIVDKGDDEIGKPICKGGKEEEKEDDRKQKKEEEDRDDRENEENDDKKKSEWTTSIVLPLKETVKEHGQMRSLAARFNDVHPSLLLFLHRLKNLSVINKVENYEQNIQRKDLANGLVEISHSSGTDRWLVIKQMLDASKISEQAKSGVEVESTEIALAFQLQDKSQRQTQVLPQKQPVFAFLPLRSYGFRFVIQGDFDVPSSREDVDRDSVWNQWLIGNVHELFVNALSAFKAQPGVDEIDAVCMFLQYLPLEDEILDFFRPVATKILHQIRAKPCLPSQPGKNKIIQWKMPSKLVVCKDSLVREIVKSELLHEQLSLDYLHPDVVSRLNSSLINTLGVQTLTTQHLLDLGKTTIAQLVAQQSSGPDAYTKKLEFLAKWLTCIFRSIDEIQPEENVIIQLKELPIMPLASTTMVKLSEKTVFFPITDERKKASRKQKPNHLMRILAQDLDTIDPQLFNCLDDVANSQVHKLLDMLGVKVMTPFEVINHHIMPVLKSERKMQKSREMLFAYMVYIKEELEGQPDLLDKEELKKHAIVLTNRGARNPASSAVHFSTTYGNQIDLPRMLPGYDWVLVDACYLQGASNSHDIQRWYNFLAGLGVLDFLSIKQTTMTVKRDDLDETPWAAVKEFLPNLEEYKIVDSVSTELDALLTENKSPANYFDQMKCLFQLIDINFDALFKKHTIARIMNLDDHILRDVESTFANYLKNMPWLPASVIERKDAESAELVERKNTMISNNLFVRNAPNIAELLYYHVPYLDCEISSNSTFSDFLGIKKNIGIEDVKKMLIQWCSRKSGEDGEILDEKAEAELVTSMGHIKKVYQYLHGNMPPRAFQELINDHPIIFYTQQIPKSPVENVKGTFLYCNQVWYTDSSNLFGKYAPLIPSLDFQKVNRPLLRKIYPEVFYKDLFVKHGRVPLSPDYQEYAKLLCEIPSVATSVKDALPDVLQLLHILANKVLLTDESVDYSEDLVKMQLSVLKKILQDALVLPTKANRWAILDTKAMIADDRQMEKMWNGKPGVCFVDLGEKKGYASKNKELIDSIVKLLKQLGVSSLSEMVRMEPTTTMYEACPQLQYYVYKVVPFLQQIIYDEHPEVYQALKDYGIKAKLAALRFGQVKHLELVYSLQNVPNCDPVVKEDKCRIVNDEDFYILKDLVRSFYDINSELARFFGHGNAACERDVRVFLTDLLPLVENEDNLKLQEYIEQQSWMKLPEKEEIWEVPKPNNWPPAPEPPPMQLQMMYGNQMAGYPIDQEQLMTTEPDETSEQSESQKKESGSAVRAWPPQAPGTRGYGSGEKKNTSSWPPPAPPRHSNYKDLPESMRQLPPRLQKAKENESGDKNEGKCNTGSDRPQSQPHRSESEESRDNMSGPHFQGQRSQPIEDGIERREAGSNSRDSSKPGASEQVMHGTTQNIQGSVADKAPEMGSMSEGESYSTLKGDDVMITNQPATSHVPRNQNETVVEENAIPHSRNTTQYSRSQSQTEMEYIEDNDGHVVNVDETFHGHHSQGSGSQTRVARKRARMASSGEYKHDETARRKPVLFFGNPIWMETTNADEPYYEELAQSKTLSLPDDAGVLCKDSAPLDVAIWGEKLVKSYLLQLQQDPANDIVEVTWMNEDEETGAPYDFVLKVRDPQNKEVIDVFVEVKSTQTDKKAFFEISSQQFKFAQEEQDNFHLYRVFNAGDQTKARLTKLVNIAQLLDKKQVRLCMVV